MTDIVDDDYNRPQTGTHARKAAVREHAEHLAATRGGNVEDHEEQAERETPHNLPRFRDDHLTTAGFKLTHRYAYTDPSEKTLYYSLRYTHETVPGAKEFLQCRWFTGFGAPYVVAGAGPIKIPYRWHEIVKRPSELLVWAEGEKDADKLASLGLLASTAAGQKLSSLIAKAMAGRDIAILEDNDAPGRKNAQAAYEAFRDFAKSVRIVRLPDLPPTGDVSDWLDAGHGVDELKKIIASTRVGGFQPTPAEFKDPASIPRREWLYKPSYVRQFLSVLVSHGGSGKSTLLLTEALAMVTGKPLLGVQPALLGEVQADRKPLRVWYVNLEDPKDEIQRRFAAACLQYGITEKDIGGRLFFDSGRETPIVIAETDGRTREARVSEPTVQRLIEQIKKNEIDVMIVDPFVKSHRLGENDNAGMDRVAEAWARIADVTGCSVMISHHTRKGKGNGDSYSVEDSRGAIALIDASRSARVLNRMTQTEAEGAGIDERERWRYFRSDNGKISMGRAAEHSDWFKIESLELPNRPKGPLPEGSFEIDGDDVGVVVRFNYPRPKVPEMTSYKASAILAAIRGGRWRADSQATKEPWVGVAIAVTLGVSLQDKVQRVAVRKLIHEWLTSGWLKKVTHLDANSTPREYIEVGPAAPADPLEPNTSKGC